jgi:hypothetical protein
VGRGTEEKPFTERAGSACTRARKAKVRQARRLAQRRIVAVGVDKSLVVTAFYFDGLIRR